MTVASEQCVIVGVILTSTWVRVFGSAFAEGVGVMAMSGRLTTASCPREIGCSGSEILDIKSVKRQLPDVRKESQE